MTDSTKAGQLEAVAVSFLEELGASIDEVIDQMLTHDSSRLPAHAEVATALRRLTSAGLAVVSGDAMELSAAGRDLAGSVRRYGERRRADAVETALLDAPQQGEAQGSWLTPERWSNAVTRCVERAMHRLAFREEIVSGVLRALEDAENVGRTIRKQPDRKHARAALMRELGYSEIQANHVLDMTFSRQTAQGMAELRDEREFLKTERERLAALLRGAVSGS